MLLAGDIGGTKSDLAVVSSEDGPRTPLVEATLPSGDYPTLEALARAFLSRVGLKVEYACLGVAGPVVEGRATITNLSWSIDSRLLQSALGLRAVSLLNDLEAIAYALPLLETEDLHVINPGRPADRGAMAILAPGTGLGEAFLTWAGDRYQAHASEGGHADFAPNTAIARGLLGYLADQFGHVSYERVCSGLGIPNIYAYLKEIGHAPEPAWMATDLARAPDPTPVIVNNALDEERRCKLCADTLGLFVSIMAAEAGNLALRVMATGGVYLGGGIPPRILPALDPKRFMSAFANKGRLAHLLVGIPVHVILNAKAALLGAAAYGLETEGRL